MKNIGFIAAAALFAACGPSVKSITLTPPKAPALTAKGQPVTFKADPKNDKGQPVPEALNEVKWSSSSPDVATVDNGKVTAVKSGETTITAAVGEIKGSTQVVVSIPAALEVTPKKLDAMMGQPPAHLAAQVKDENGKPVNAPVTWTSSDDKVAKVAGGQVLAQGAGTATITATVGSLKDTATVEVKVPEFAKVTIDPSKHALNKAGETVQLKASALDAKGTAVNGVPLHWLSSDDKVATVNQAGMVTAMKRGKAKITAMAGNKGATSEIVVKK